MTAPGRYVSCPRCGAQVAWAPENPFRPFCSERCRMVDLGAWATEQYRVPTDPEREGLEETRQDEDV